MDVWNYILGYRNTLKSVFETWVVHIPFKYKVLLPGSALMSTYMFFALSMKHKRSMDPSSLRVRKPSSPRRMPKSCVVFS